MTRRQRWIGLLGALVALTAGALLWTSLRHADSAQAAPPPPPAERAENPIDPQHIPSAAPAAAREDKRMRRYDRNHDQRVSYEEYLASRRKAFARLDKDKDGRLSFEEYAVKTIEKFRHADANGDQQLNAREFATTASRKASND